MLEQPVVLPMAQEMLTTSLGPYFRLPHMALYPPILVIPLIVPCGAIIAVLVMSLSISVSVWQWQSKVSGGCSAVAVHLHAVVWLCWSKW